jgi:YVTN family beta-propeller protein
VVDPASGKVYVAGKFGSAVAVIDGTTGARLARIPTPSPALDLCLNPRESKIYAACQSANSVVVIDAQQDSIVAEVPVGTLTQTLCYSSRSNKIYCSSGIDTAIVVIDGASNQVVATIRVPINVDVLCYDSRDDRLFCACSDALADAMDSVIVIDCASDTTVQSVTVGVCVTSMAYDSILNLVYCGQIDSILAIDGATCGVAYTVPLVEPMAVHSDQRGHEFYCVASTWDTLFAIDAVDGTVAGRVALPDAATDMVYLPELGKAVCCTYDGHAYVVDVVGRRITASLDVGDNPTSLVADESRSLAYCLGSTWDDVAVIDVRGDSVLTTAPVGARPRVMCWNDARGLLYVASESSSVVSAIDPQQAGVTAVVRVGRAPAALCNPGDGDRLFCANSGGVDQPDSTVSVIDTRLNAEVRRLTVGRSPVALCYVAAHNEIWCASRDAGHISIIDVESESVVARVTSGPHLRRLVHDSVHDKVYCYWWDGDYYGAVGVYDAATRSYAGYVVSNEIFSCMSFVPSSGKLYLGSNRLCVVPDYGDSMVTIIPHPGGIWTSLASDPAGQRVYCLNDGYSRLLTLDGTTDSIVADIDLPQSPGRLTFDPNSDCLVVSRPNSDLLYLVDRNGLAIIDSVSVGDSPMDLLAVQDIGIFAANIRGSSVSLLKANGAIEDGRSSGRIGENLSRASICRGPLRSQSPTDVVFDACGRVVARGGERMQFLRAGVYFVRREDGTTRKALVAQAR